MTDGPDDSNRTMRDTFEVWNLDTTEREVVLQSSDDQYVAIPLPEGKSDLFEELAEGQGTVEATLVRDDGAGTSWRLDVIHGVEQDE